MPQWQRPENALRRANELLEVGKKQDALDTLHDVIKARKHRTWTKVHEQIMSKHLELCVVLRKPHLAKDGLFQYRNMCQQVNVKSLEDVVTAFLEHAERKADQARQASQGLVEDVAEDLDQAESPERLLLSAVSGEGAQDRADRAVLSPWLRFLWESYRQCLELLRNNVQVEQLYHKVAKQAFQFCLKYQRRTEFRKLCDNLRTHVNQLQKAHTHFAVKLTNPETLALHQETRLTQLDVAIQMELWQEAYKSAEDVHQLMQSAKRLAKAHTLASYYERLALVFWKAGNTLYHTAALFKLFQLHKDLKKSFSSDEATHLATRVLLATLSIRSSDQVHDLARHLEMEEAHLEHQRRLASLLSWPTPPTRQFLLKELQRVNVIGLALQPAQQLHQWLECEFSPLKLAPEIQRLLTAVQGYGKNEYSQYIDALQHVAALKILKQVSQIYRSISIERFLSIVPFFDLFQLERLIVIAGKKAQMQVRIDHRTGSVEFGVGEALTFGSDEDETVSGLTSAQLDVPVIQAMPSEQIRQYLQQMYTVLKESVDSVDQESVQSITEKLKNNARYYDYHKLDHHKHTLERKKRIEAYKEALEKIKTEQEEFTRLREKLELEKRQREDQQRLAQENQLRTEAQRRREMEEKHRRMMEDRVGRFKDKKLGEIFKNLPEEEMLDPAKFLETQISHLEKEKREQLAKMSQQQKKWDYYVRAIHLEEIPLREQEYHEMAVKERQLWEEHEAERVKREEEEHFAKLSNNKRLARLEKDASDYLATIRESRAAEIKRRMEEWERNLQETKQRRLLERKEERKETRRQQWLKAKAEAERLKKEEEERKKKEAEEQSRRPGAGGGEDADRRQGKTYGDRRYQQGGGASDGGSSWRQPTGEPRGSEAEQWARGVSAGPPEPVAAKQPTYGERRQAGGADREGPGRQNVDETRGADADQWARVAAPPVPEPAPQPRQQPSYGDRSYQGGASDNAGSWRQQPVSEPRGSDAEQWNRASVPGPLPPKEPGYGERRYQGGGPGDRAAGPWRQQPVGEPRGADSEQWARGVSGPDSIPPKQVGYGDRDRDRRGDRGYQGGGASDAGSWRQQPTGEPRGADTDQRRQPGYGEERRFGSGRRPEQSRSGADSSQQWRRDGQGAESDQWRK